MYVSLKNSLFSPAVSFIYLQFYFMLHFYCTARMCVWVCIILLRYCLMYIKNVDVDWQTSSKSFFCPHRLHFYNQLNRYWQTNVVSSEHIASTVRYSNFHALLEIRNFAVEFCTWKEAIGCAYVNHRVSASHPAYLTNKIITITDFLFSPIHSSHLHHDKSFHAKIKRSSLLKQLAGFLFISNYIALNGIDI